MVNQVVGDTVVLGVERLLRNLDMISGNCWGLVTNYTGVTSNFTLSSEALLSAGAPLTALFSPEHGLRGTAQAGFSEAETVDPITGLPVVDTYQMTQSDLRRAIENSGIDVLLVDLQDIGLRFYTYVWTMLDCMRAAAQMDVPVVVLDRPNPLGGTVEGPGLEDSYSSFVGRINIPIRHGLTIGELARVAAIMEPSKELPMPQVVEMAGWTRSMLWEDTRLPWVMPSPNIPTPASALVYAGTALFEGTNMSEGRGTTRPFELVGAPWLDESYAQELERLSLPGVRFRSAWFTPTFSKHAGAVCGGVQIYVVDQKAYLPLNTAIHMLAVAMDMGAGEFQWREPSWEGGKQRPPFIDLLWGSSLLRQSLDAGNILACNDYVVPTMALQERMKPGHLYRNDDR